MFECPCDADTTIVKVALEYSKEQPIIVHANDTDILSLLLHHYHNTPDLKDIFLTEMTRKSDHQQRKCYSIREVISQLLKRGEPTMHYLLFAHSFSFFLFFFYQGFLSRPFTNYRTTGEGGGHFFNSSLTLPPASQTFRH